MLKALVLALLLVFALLGQVPSENDPPISFLKTEAISIAATQQVTPAPTTVFPKTDIPNTPAVPQSPTAPKTPGITTPPSGTSPQMNPSLAAVHQMNDAAKQMAFQMKRHQKEMAKLLQDPTMMSNPAIRSRVATIQANGAPTQIQRLAQDTENLLKGVLQLLKASGGQ